MNPNPLPNPLPSEHVVEIQPELAPQVTTPWRRRLNLFTGRSLSATALETEQEGRAGHLATYGQRVSSGVVQGLEVVLDDAPTANEATLLVTAGHGITALGEDVFLPLNRQVRLLDIPVIIPVDLEEGETEEELPEAPEEPPLGETREPPLRRRTLRGRMADLIRSGEASELPPVAILVLQPVVAEVRGEFDPTDPCEEDPQNYAFEDWQRVDGCRLVLYSYPEEWQTDFSPLLSEEPSPTQIHRWRSRIAHGIFQREGTLRSDEILPWAEWGVPVALMGFGQQPAAVSPEPAEPGDEETIDAEFLAATAAWFPLFADGYAVVRQGGEAKRRSQPQSLGSLRQPFLWQARVQQFAEHLTEMPPITNPEEGAERRQGFHRLPPVGVLPNAALDLASNRLPFFPLSYEIRLQPIPQEQLDAVMVASAGLEPFNPNRPEQVQVLLPVPQSLYDPNLLDFNTTVPQEFLDQIQAFTQRRAVLLQCQQDLRQKLQGLYTAIQGESLDFAAADADILDPDETPATGTLDPPEEAYGTSLEDGQRVAQPLAALRERLQQTALRREVDRYLDPDASDFEGLTRFIEILEDKVKRANDPIDFGFLRVRSDLYRIRQFMLGAEEASRLVTSPVLADIVKEEESAFLTQQNLSNIFSQLRQAARQGESQEAEATSTGGRGTSLSGGTSPSAGSFSFAPAVFNTPLNFTLFSQELIGATQQSQATSPVAAANAASVESRIGSRTQAEGGAADSIQIANTLRIAQAFNPATQLFRPPTMAAPQEAVIEQLPLLGAVSRSATVGERLKPGEALDSLNFAVEGQLQTVQLLALRDGDTGESLINVEDLEIPGTRASEDAAGLSFSALQDAVNVLQRQKLTDTQQAPDEARLYERGIKSLEDTVGTLRLIEGRVQQYRLAIADCRRVLKQLRDFLNRADTRLKTVGDELAEARHDVAIAQALREEEQARLQALVEQRRQILQNHVPFLVFHRPRRLSPRISMPHHGVNPGLAAPAVPVCLKSHPPLPSELRRAVNLLQDAPVKWFTQVTPLLNRFDQLPLLRDALCLAQGRAERAVPLLESTPQSLAPNPGSLGQAISRTVLAQTQVVRRYRVQTAQFNLSSAIDLSWSRSLDRARDLLALGDLLTGPTQRSDVARQVNREIDLITQVAGCLYASFSDVLPQIRLQWAERLSQYDDPISLRQMASLPRWNQIPYLDRRQMQELVDWLYSRINAKEADAVALMHDLVRICILLASHAPVSQIITGRVSKPTTLRPGGRVDLTIDPGKIRIGMPVFLYGANNQVVAEAQVEDLSASQAAAKVVRMQRAVVQVGEGARVRFGWGSEG